MKLKCYIFFLSLFFITTFSHAEDKIHTVLVLKDWKPYYSLDKNGNPQGYAIDLFEAIAKDIGIKYRYKVFDNWTDMNPYRQSEEYIVPNTGIAKMRADYTLFSNPTDTFEITHFKRKTSFDIKNKNDLFQKSVAIVKDNICMKLVTSKDSHKILFDDHLTALSALLSGEVDAMCYPKPLLENTLKTLHLADKIVSFGKPLQEIKRGLGLSHGHEHQQLISMINQSFEKLKKNGTYKKIYQKWFGEEEGIKLSYEEMVLLMATVIVIFVVLVLFVYFWTRKQKWLLTKSELENKVEEKTNRFELAIKASKAGIWEWNYKSNTLIWDKKMYEIYGIDQTDVKELDTIWTNSIDKEDLEKIEEKLNHALKTHSDYNVSFWITTPKGDRKYIQSLGVHEYDENDIPIKMVGTNIDITEQKLKDIELKKEQNQVLEQKKEFELIFESTKDGIAIVNLESTFLNCNDAFLELTGYTKDEIRLKKCRDLTLKEDRQKNDDAIQYAIENGHIENIEKRCVTKNDKIFVVNMSISMLPDEKRLLLSLKDVSSLKLLEQQSKLASMGEMIGNIAHQWRQPLSVISTATTGMQMQKQFGKLKDEDFEQMCDTINNNVQYLSKTIDNFRDFIKGDISYVDTSVKKALERTIGLIEASLKMNFITLVVDLSDDLIITGNIHELEQAFINIINNSKDALKEKIFNEKDRFIFISTQKPDENSLELIIKDSGGGIDSKIINRIFEPYFTTKHQSRGTGLGLSMADQIIRERHKGDINVYNEEFEYNNQTHKGACFNIVFKK